jgi:hypothetical protein
MSQSVPPTIVFPSFKIIVVACNEFFYVQTKEPLSLLDLFIFESEVTEIRDHWPLMSFCSWHKNLFGDAEFEEVCIYTIHKHGDVGLEDQGGLVERISIRFSD